VRLNFN